MEVVNKELKRLKLIVESIPANVFFKDIECRYQLASHVCSMLNGGEKGESIIGKTDLEVQLEPELGKQYYNEDKKLIREGGEIKYISEMHFANKTYYYEVVKRAIVDDTGRICGIVGMVTDMTELIVAQNKLKEISIRDSMTGAYNRLYLQQWIREGYGESELPISLVVCDCNDLKYINDTYGHNTGDEYIKEAVNILTSNTRDCDIIIRIGGDEFLIISEDCDEQSCKEMTENINRAGRTINIADKTMSIATGYYVITSPDTDIYQAVEIADQNMYHNKQEMKRLMQF